MWSGNFKTATTALKLTKWRSFFTMLGIIIGISSVVTIVSLGEGLKHQVVGQINQLGSDVITVRSGKIVRQGDGGLNLLAFFSASTLTEKDVASLDRLKSVTDVTPFDFVTSSVKSDRGAMDDAYVVGTTPNMTHVLRQSLSYGSFLTEDDSDKNFTVIGTQAAHKLFGEFNPVGESLEISGQSFIVRGVLAPTSGGLLSVAQTDFNSGVFIPFTVSEQLGERQPNILQVLVRAKNPKNVDGAIANIESALKRNHGSADFSVLKQYELLDIAGGVVNTVTGFISAIAAISLLVGGIGIMDIMLVSVSERTREIGIRKAVGATNRQILNQFLVEGLVLTITGGVIGIIFSLLINMLLKLYTDWSPVISWPVLVLAVAISILVGVIFSAAPALKAARKDPIEALRA